MKAVIGQIESHNDEDDEQSSIDHTYLVLQFSDKVLLKDLGKSGFFHKFDIGYSMLEMAFEPKLYSFHES